MKNSLQDIENMGANVKPTRRLLHFFAKSICFTTLFLLGVGASAQNDSLFRVLPEIKYPATDFEVDPLGALYIISTENRLIKLDENGDSSGVFNRVSTFGKLSYVVAENPWKTLLFYKNFSTVVLLDKYLDVSASINLKNKGIFSTRAVTTSYDNNIWLFDEQENTLKKISESGDLLLQSVDFRQLLNEVVLPVKILDRDGFVYLFDAEKGIYIFDYYGTYKRKIAVSGWTNFTVIGKTIYGFDSGTIYKTLLDSPDITRFTLPEWLRGSKKIVLNNSKMYALKNGRIVAGKLAQ